MEVVQRLLEAGFARVIVLDGKACGIAEKTLLLAVMPYEAEEKAGERGAWIHPYYFASQRAYLAARELAEEAAKAGVPLRLRDDVSVKPIFARIPYMTQGRNTLSYLPGIGSRFHVQIFALDEALEPSVRLTDEPHDLHCGDCTLCYRMCPTGALDASGFHREKCLRNWQLGGRPVPEEIRALMGNRLIGCDECQRECPHNPRPMGKVQETADVGQMLENTKAACEKLKGDIGANLALPNRVLAQACLIAGNDRERSHIRTVAALRDHPSPVVAEHAAWACGRSGEEAARADAQNSAEKA